MQTLHYFQENPNLLQLTGAGKGRFSLSALYKTNQTAKTIVLISHYDTVHVEEYGDNKDLAFQPNKLTTYFTEQKTRFSTEVQRDIESNDYLFGRGIMDMKIGIALHLQLLERATVENWPINILFVTVPDEEVNSAGMRAVIPTIAILQEHHELDIELFLNGEPSFSQYPEDENYYLYTGSIGKIMPSALFYGQETHAGEPLGGMTGQFMASFLTRKMEWNDAFSEEILQETTPLPVTLSQMDLKTNIPHKQYRERQLYTMFL